MHQVLLPECWEFKLSNRGSQISRQEFTKLLIDLESKWELKEQKLLIWVESPIWRWTLHKTPQSTKYKSKSQGALQALGNKCKYLIDGMKKNVFYSFLRTVAVVMKLVVVININSIAPNRTFFWKFKIFVHHFSKSK